MCSFHFVLQPRKLGAEVVRIKKKANGEMVQACDVYIGGPISNERWTLLGSKWESPYFLNGGTAQTALPKYEEYVRSCPDLVAALPELEGKTLGCWCKPRPCHGDVLVMLLEEFQTNKIKAELLRCGLRIKSDDYANAIRHSRGWAQHPLWLAHATRLDDSNLYYFTPETYVTLRHWLGGGPPYWPAFTNDDAIYFVVGVYDGEQPLGPFWVTGIKDNITPQPSERIMLQFAERLQIFLDRSPAEFQSALKRAMDYHGLHRKIVRACGAALGVDMEDHDLTKSRLVQVALAYMWHWVLDHDDELAELARAMIKTFHCEREDHHPEFEAAGCGAVDPNKLIVDRLAVHLQKDPQDRWGGWAVRELFIPPEYKEFWKSFRLSYGHINLYEEAYVPGMMVDPRTTTSLRPGG